MLAVMLLSCALAAGQQNTAGTGAPPAEQSELGTAAPAAPRLFEQEAYDLIRFKDETEIKVQPLSLRGRQLPENPRSTDKLIVRTLDDPNTEYEVVWKDIGEIKLFEQLILEEAERLVSAGKFNEAYDYYHYLERYHPKLPGLATSMESYLFKDAIASQQQGKYEQSLALLNEVYRRNPKRDGLAATLDAVTSNLVEQKVENEQFAAAKQLVQSVLERFPATEAAAAWRTRIQDRARQRLSTARDHLTAERYREAAEEAQQALRIWPLKEARDVWAQAHQRFPRVVVGVTLPGGRTEADPMVDWAARRSARLFNRSLLEFQGYGPQGGIYDCPVGEIERLDLGLRWSIRLRPNTAWSTGDSVVTGHDVARRLLLMTDRNHPAYRADWADLFARVTVRNVYDVDVELRRAHVHPDGMLQTVLRPWNLAAQDDLRAASLGPYVVASTEDQEVSYVANERYFAASSAQPKEIVERFYPQSRRALSALKNGEIAMLDRVLPWDLEALGEQKNLTVEPYAVPTIHCLLPNYGKPFLTRRTFRRALQYAINREQILRQQLTTGSPSLGRVISGPFPRGEGIDDPLGYAYNEEIQPRGWQPYLAMALVKAAQHELAPPVKKQAPAASSGPAENGQSEEAEPPKPELPPVPELILAHPPHDMARVACRAIQQQLELIGLTVKLAETDANAPAAPSGDWDLLFVELAMWEPIIDAKRLLGPEGIVGRASPYMDLALRELEIAEDWKRARERLLQVHRVAHYDLPVIPLWQITDHFAYQKGLRGVGSTPAMLYQNIESWQSPPWFSEEAP